MNEPAWYVYERDFAMRWCAAVYYGDKPKAKKHSEVMMTTPIQVPSDCLSEDGSPHFGELARRFPAPIEREDDDG